MINLRIKSEISGKENQNKNVIIVHLYGPFQSLPEFRNIFSKTN